MADHLWEVVTASRRLYDACIKSMEAVACNGPESWAVKAEGDQIEAASRDLERAILAAAKMIRAKRGRD